MSNNKKDSPITSSEIDSLLANFKSNIENQLGKENGEFNRIIMPEPIIMEENIPVSESHPSAGQIIERKVRFNPHDTKKETPDQAVVSGIEPAPVETPQTNNTVEESLPVKELLIAEESPYINSLEKRKNALFNFIKIIVLAALLSASAQLLSSGSKMNINTETDTNRNGMSVFNSSAANLLSDSLNEIYKLPKVYLLELNNDPAPVPDKNSFTKIDDNERKNYNGSQIDYYKDETIEVKCWKEENNGVIVNFAEVKIAHPSQFRRKLVDNVISNKHLDYPLNIFRNVNGVVGMTSDYCAFRSIGTIVQHGKTVRSNSKGNLDILIYDNEGNLSSMTNQDFESSDLYGSDKVVYTFAFGPVLVDNYEICTGRRAANNSNRIIYPIGEVNVNYPRAAIGQFGCDKHYLLCTVDYRSNKLRGTTVSHLAEIMKEKGCRFAYNMDGGQTSTLMFNSNIFNKVAYGGQREVSDIMYFATAIPNE